MEEFLRTRGGRAVFLLDLSDRKYPNRDRLLASYGIDIRPALVIEENPSNFLPNQPHVLIPSMVEHAIMKPLGSADMPILFPLAQVISLMDIKKRRVTIEPLLATSNRAWAQVNLGSKSSQKTANDLDGPFILAVAITDKGETGEKESRIVVTSSAQFLYPSKNFGQLPVNESFFRNSLNWLRGAEELISIQPRSVSTTRYNITLSSLQFYLFVGITVLLVPALIFGAGLAVYLRRRHR